MYNVYIQKISTYIHAYENWKWKSNLLNENQQSDKIIILFCKWGQIEY